MKSTYLTIVLTVCALSLAVIAACLVYAFAITSPNQRAIKQYAEYANLLKMLEQQGQWEKANAISSAYLNEYPLDLMSRWVQAESLYNLGEVDKAEAGFIELRSHAHNWVAAIDDWLERIDMKQRAKEQDEKAP